MAKKFDLINRTNNFSKSLLKLAVKIKLNAVNKSIVEQLIRSATSVGANYHEADSAESKKDFIHKLGISKKESRESEYWFGLLLETNPEFSVEIQILKTESRELFLIFNSIISKSRVGIEN